MTILGHGDYLALLDFLKDVLAATGVDELRQRVLRAVQQLVPCDHVSYDEVHPGQGTFSLVVPFDVHLPESEETLAGHAMDNPVVTRLRRATSAQVLKISDLIARRELQRHELYQQLCRRVGAENQIAFGPPSRKPRVVGITLSRRLRDFDERDRQLLALAQPHLVQAHRSALLADRLQTALTQSGQALAVLDRAGRVRFATRLAGRLFEDYFGRAEIAGLGLPEALRDWVDGERSRLGAAGVSAPARPFVARPFVAGESCRQLVARFISGGHALDEDSILLSEEVDPEKVELASLGLSRREAEVLALVAEGKADAEIAEALVVSPRTVQKHLEHVYQKLGVPTRTAAVTLALGLIGGKSARRRLDAA